MGGVEGADAVDLISNGDFRSQLSGWTAEKFFPFDKAGQGHNDSRYAYFGAAANGSTPLTNATGSIYQSVAIPAGARGVSLSFWLRITTDEPTTDAFDTLTALLQDSDGNTLKTLGTFSNGDALGFSQWLKKSYSIGNYTGQTVRVCFKGKSDSAKLTVFRIDDVSLSAEPPAGDIQLTINDADGDRLATSDINSVILFDSNKKQIDDASPPTKNSLTFDDVIYGDYYAFVFCWDMLAGESGTFKHDDSPTKETFRCYKKRKLVIKSLASDSEAPIAGIKVELYSENGQSKKLTRRAEETSDSDGEVSFLAWPINHSDGRYLVRQSYNGATLRETFVTLKDESGTETKGLSIDVPPGTEPTFPVALFDLSDYTPDVNQGIRFDASLSRAIAPKTIKKYEWRFNGGAVITGASVTQKFSTFGYHTISLTVEDSAGLRSTVAALLSVGGLTGSPQTNLAAHYADPVNLATGNFIYSYPALTIPGRGIHFDFALFYNSKSFDPEAPTTSLGPVGHGWTHSYQVKISSEQPATGDSVAVLRTVTFGDDSREVFRKTGTTWMGEPGVFNQLVENGDGTFELKTKTLLRYRFDASGWLASISDRNNNVVTITRDGTGKVNFVTDTVGRTVDFVYSENGLLEKIVDPIGRIVTFSYDERSDLRSISDPRTKVTSFTYDALHQMLTGTDPKGRIFVRNEYDNMERVAKYQEDALKHPTSFAYDFTTHITTVTDANSKQSFYHHDDRLRVIKIIDPLGHTQEFGYDENDNRTRVADANGRETTYAYDSRGNVTKKTDPDTRETAITYNDQNDPELRTERNGRQTKYEYDARGNPSAVTFPYLAAEPTRFRRTFLFDEHGLERKRTDALGRETTFDYDALANLTKVVDALDHESSAAFDGVGRKLSERDAREHETTFTWDEADNLKTATDASGVVEHFYDDNGNREKTIDQKARGTIFAYDEKDRLSSVTNPLNQTVTTTYDAFDRKASVIDAREQETKFTYDAAGRLISVTDPLGHATLYTHDPVGNVLTETDADGVVTTYAYDKLNRRTSVKNHVGNEAVTVFDAIGQVEKTTDPENRATTFTYTPAGQLETVTDAARGISRFTYDHEGNRLSMIDPRGKETTYDYDKLNRRTFEKDPLQRVTSWTYDAVGNVATITSPRDLVVEHTYDALDRLTKITPPTGPPTEFTYDAVGNRLTMTDALGATTWDYDRLDRVTAVTDPFGQKIGFGYDRNGNRETVAYPGEKVVTYAYDAANRLASLTDWQSRKIEQTYTKAGRLAAITYPNGVKTAVGHDSAGRLDGISHQKGADAPFASFGYTFTASGDITSTSETLPLPERILGSSSVTYTYDDANQLATANGLPFSHDPAGNITKGPLGSDSAGDDSLGWDYADRLTTATIGGKDATITYNGLGHRLASARDGATTRFVVDGTASLDQILAETSATGEILAYYLYAEGLAARIEADGTTRYYHADRRGNVATLTNKEGAVTDAYAYDPFGIIINQSGETQNPFRFLGSSGIYDNGDGTLYVRARHYHPRLGRFLSKDALSGDERSTQAINRYAYALNNPMRLVDVSGYESQAGTRTTNPSTTTDTENEPLFWIDFINALGPRSYDEVVAPLINDFDEGNLAFRDGRYVDSLKSYGLLFLQIGPGKPLKGLEYLGETGKYLTHGHHPIPKFLGGHDKQDRTQLEVSVHLKEFHSTLFKKLETMGMPRRSATREGWRRFFTANPGSQKRAFDALFEQSREVDYNRGTNITHDLWDNFLNGRFDRFP